MFRGVGRLVLLVLIFLMTVPFAASAASVQYFYDDAGRLIKAVSDSGQAATYDYDQVGNLLGSASETYQALPPEISSISPDRFFAGESASVTISGSNLGTTESVTSDNSGITVSNVKSTDSSITATFTLSSTASTGQATITVTTQYGTASVGLGVYKVSVDPGAAYILKDQTQDLKLTMTPALTGYSFSITNSNSDIISAPTSAISDSAGSASITVKALKEGAGVLKINGAAPTIFVTTPYSGDGISASRLICVNMETLPSGTLMSSRSVTVEPFYQLISTYNSHAVTAAVDHNDAGNYSSHSLTVSNIQVSGAVTVSRQVNAKINGP